MLRGHLSLSWSITGQGRPLQESFSTQPVGTWVTRCRICPVSLATAGESPCQGNAAVLQTSLRAQPAMGSGLHPPCRQRAEPFAAPCWGRGAGERADGREGGSHDALEVARAAPHPAATLPAAALQLLPRKAVESRCEVAVLPRGAAWQHLHKAQILHLLQKKALKAIANKTANHSRGLQALA